MRILRIAFAIFWACGFILGCQKEAAQNSPEAAVIGLTSDFDTLLELGTANSDALHVIEEMLFLTLCELDENLSLQPRLAESWHFNADGDAVTFALRGNVLWSDGKPVTAEDVLFTYQLAVNPQVGYTGRDRFTEVDTVVVLDPHTIKFKFKKAYPDALLDLQIPILPKHILKNIPPEQLRQSAFNRQPIGNGPFVLKEWRANDRLVFEANARYFGGRPKLDRVVFRIVPDETVLLSSVLTGEIDLLPYVAPNKLQEIEHKSDLQLLRYPDRGYSFLAFNLKRPVFQDRRVRQAIVKAIQRQNLVDVLLNGQGRLVAGPIPPYFWAADESLPIELYDAEEAKELLNLAGWVDRNHDGWREKGNQPLEFTMKTNADNKLRSDALVMIQADLEKVGIQAKPELLEFGKLVEDVLQRRDFDAVLLSWKTGYSVNPSQVWHSDAIDNGYNLGAYRNPQVDSLLAAARQENDRAKAKPLWCAFQQLIAEDCPYVFLYNQDNPAIVRQRLQNVKIDVRGYLINVEEWSINGSDKEDSD
jgi:peptide/nickel transport system substrate-binding protein